MPTRCQTVQQNNNESVGEKQCKKKEKKNQHLTSMYKSDNNVAFNSETPTIKQKAGRTEEQKCQNSQINSFRDADNGYTHERFSSITTYSCQWIPGAPMWVSNMIYQSDLLRAVDYTSQLLCK